MPFTVVTDTLLAVLPEAEYAKVKVGNEKWIFAKQRVEPVMQELKVKEYQVTETIIGKKLVGVKYYYPFLDTIPKQQELDKEPLVHTVIGEDFVDVSTATGVVHLSPGNGEDDFRAAQKHKVPIYVPFDDDARFTAEAGEFADVFARDADSMVIDILRKKNLLVSVKMVRHEYPTCWRSHHLDLQSKRQSSGSSRKSRLLFRRTEEPFPRFFERKQTMVCVPRPRVGRTFTSLGVRKMQKQSTNCQQKRTV